jgi:HAD superfamily hydrolase (TIGR01509 family)
VRFTAVVLDWDGTVVDSQAAIVQAVQATSATLLGDTYPADHRQAGELLTLRADELWGLLSDDLRVQRALARQYELEYRRCVGLLCPYPDTVQTLAGLRSLGIAIAVTTTKTAACVHADAAHCGLGALVDEFITVDDVDARPPDPRLLEHALHRLGVAPHDALAVGDSPDDLIASRSVGVANAAAMYSRAYPAEDLLRQGPDLRIETLLGLLDVTGGAAAAS